ncbi:hypothetical protein BV25DRAFT_1827739 [Artomyces pyxidatus]|uniref:Uncharacterized protein n=1 Tax=Artomyces pyxidatus TaxID=48021 RepID=A0ACB8SWE0_9AGAM|nr:hypothetical protein BV25DRAFT_1827739 [Artomyces pyxidatus]
MHAGLAEGGRAVKRAQTSFIVLRHSIYMTHNVQQHRASRTSNSIVHYRRRSSAHHMYV